MPTRSGHARWEGSLKGGKGTVELAGGAFRGAYSSASRFEEGAGTNPEELLGAAHAACFAMALASALGKAGFTPERGRRDGLRHGGLATGLLRDHREPSRLRGPRPRHRRGDVRKARRRRQEGLPGVAGARRRRDHPRRQALRGVRRRDRMTGTFSAVATPLRVGNDARELWTGPGPGNRHEEARA
jgi:hypothetical protein